MAFRPQNGVDLASQKIVNVADPSSPQDGATKNYVDSVARGLDWHGHVRTIGTTNITVSSPGTAIGGVTLTSGDRVLLNAQTTASQNGLWMFNGSAAALTRPTDYASGGTLTNPAITVLVTEGTTYGNTAWTLSTDGTVTIDTTATAWVQVGGGIVYTAGNGITIAGTTVTAVAAASGGVTVTASGIGVDTTVVARKYSTNLAAATAGSTQTVTHNLGTLDVDVTVVEVSTGQDVAPDVVRTGVNTITIMFAAAITASQFRAVCMG